MFIYFTKKYSPSLLFLFLFSAIQAQNIDSIYLLEADGNPAIQVQVMEITPKGQPVKGKAHFSDENGLVILKKVGFHNSIRIQDIRYLPQELSIHKVRSLNRRITLEISMLGEITVLGSSKYEENLKEVPSKVSIIQSKEIRLLNPQTSADVLSNSGDIFVQKSQMGGGSPIIRGFEANKVLLVIDGVRMNNAIYRSGHLQNVLSLDPSTLERVEVHHGPATVMYGSDALGGVMHFYTFQPKFRRADQKLVDINAYTRFSTANFEGTGHLDFNIGRKNFASFTSVSISNFGDLRAGRLKSDPEIGTNWNRDFYSRRINGVDSMIVNENPNVQIGTAYRQINAIQKFRFRLSDQMELLWNNQLSTTSDVPRYDQLTEMTNNGHFKYAEWHYGPQNHLLSSLNLTMRNDSSSSIFNRGSITLAFQKIDEDRISRKFGDPLRRIQQEDVYVFSLNIDFVKVWRNSSKFLYGFETTYNIVNSYAESININTNTISNQGVGTRYPDGGSQQFNTSAYASYRLKLGNQANIITGIRYCFNRVSASFTNSQQLLNLPIDRINNNNHMVTSSVALAWEMDKQFQCNTSVGYSFRNPNVDDFGKIRTKNTDVILPNANLLPEKAINWEFSINKQFNQKAKWSNTFFYSYIFDAITQSPFSAYSRDSLYINGDYYNVIANTNTDRAYIWGLTSNLDIEFNKYAYLKASVAYTKGRKLQNPVVPLAHIPPLFSQVLFGYKRNLFETAIAFRYNAAKKLKDYASDSSENLDLALPSKGTPSWFTFNIYSSIKLSKYLSLNLAVENILDWHYRVYSSGVSAPGQNVILTLRGKF